MSVYHDIMYYAAYAISIYVAARRTLAVLSSSAIGMQNAKKYLHGMPRAKFLKIFLSSDN